MLLLLGAIVTALSFFGNAGETGELIDAFIFEFLGFGKWALPFLFASAALSLGLSEDRNFNSSNIFGLFLFLISSSSFLYFYNIDQGGGMLGRMFAEWIIPFVGSWISAILFSSTLIISLLLLLDTSLEKLLGAESVIFKIIALIFRTIFSPFIRKDFDESPFAKASEDRDDDELEDDEEDEKENNNSKAVIKEYDIEESSSEDSKEEDNLINDNKKKRDLLWSKTNIKMNIPLSILKSKTRKPTSGNIERNQDIIKKTLSDFGVPVSMGEVTIGPTVTQYTFKPANGISVNRIKSLSDDLALNLAIHPLRIEAPIPGKPFIGLEVPNQTKVLVSLREILNSRVFKERKTNTIVPMGRDVAGKVWFDDLIKMPHILIAGATNSGKSVFLHSLITSLLYQNNPDDLKFIMIDQKQVELSMYNGISYLMTPVITDHKKAIRALQWAVSEMDRRLEVINKAKCQNISDYNKKKNKNSMPYLVIIVDELGDLLSTAKKEAEGAIIRLGQKARASGIHLVLATQRPSVDILSGLIKANMPARAAFSVTSSINSKTILDFTGAEKLLGHGDMLYINSAMSKPVRIQGAFVDKEEIKAITKYIKNKVGKADYELEFGDRGQSDFNFGGEDEEGDVMMEEARKMIIDSGKASATMLQSRLGIGYPRANRILDNLEKQGMVGPSVQNKPREVFEN